MSSGPESVSPVYTNLSEAGRRFELRALVRYRYLLYNLVLRDLKARYKNSVLGILWSLLNPLFMTLVFTVVFTVLMPNNTIRNYAVFILVGLLPWHFFTGAVMTGTNSIVGSAGLIKKVYFPRETLPLAAVLSGLVNFLLASVILLLVLFVSGLGLTVHALWYPIILLTQVIFTLGLVFILSTANVFYRDTAMILDVLLLAWFFLTPVFYPFDLLATPSELMGITFNPAQVMRWLNPMASIVDGYRTVLWGSMESPGAVAMEPIFLLRTLVTSLIVLVAGYVVFNRHQHLFGEKL
jgi:lipopolysaccharide transport system permease protein